MAAKGRRRVLAVGERVLANVGRNRRRRRQIRSRVEKDGAHFMNYCQLQSCFSPFIIIIMIITETNNWSVVDLLIQSNPIHCSLIQIS